MPFPFHNPSTTYPVIPTRRTPKIPSDYYNLRILHFVTSSWQNRRRRLSTVNELDQFPSIEPTILDDRSLKTVSKRKKVLYIHTCIHTHVDTRHTGEFYADTRQTASRVVDSSRLSWNKYDTRGAAITLFVLGGALPRCNVYVENSSPRSLLPWTIHRDRSRNNLVVFMVFEARFNESWSVWSSTKCRDIVYRQQENGKVSV